MGIRTYNPYTPSRRQMTGSDFSEITKTTPEKSLLDSKKRKAGRNAQGKITVRHRGGGAKKKYRIVDFKRKKDGIPATVVGIEYDPNRSANIALICYADGEKAYILAPEGLKDGMTVMNGADAEVRVGNCLPLSEIPVGTQIHNIELYPGKGGQLVRSAGNSAQLMAKEGKYATLRLPSGEMRMVPIICRASGGGRGGKPDRTDLLREHGCGAAGSPTGLHHETIRPPEGGERRGNLQRGRFQAAATGKGIVTNGDDLMLPVFLGDFYLCNGFVGIYHGIAVHINVSALSRIFLNTLLADCRDCGNPS